MPSVLTIDGDVLDPAADDFLWGRLLAHARGQVPSLDFVRKCRPLAPLPDPWLGKACELEIDSVLRFAGDVVKVRHRHQPGIGWCHHYRAIGLRARGDHVPVVDDNSHTTQTLFNLPFDDRRALPSRQGRSLGQMIAQVLEGLTNSAALTAAGLVNYTSAGTGATATATVTGGSVTGVTGLVGGTGYTTAPTVLVVGGEPTERATATASVGGGAVTGVSITDGGAGYRYLPTFVFSRLPTATITDLTTGILDTLTVPHPVPFSGEKLFTAIEQALRVDAPNHMFHVEPDGTLRFLDTRTYTPATIVLNKTGGTAAERRWLMPALERSVDECYSRVEVWGDSHNEPKLLSLAAGTLYEKFGHSGLDSDEAKAAWKLGDWNDPAEPVGRATANGVRSGSAIVAITPQYGGFGYDSGSPPVVTITGNPAATAEATAVLTGDAVTSVVIDEEGSGYSTTPTVVFTGGGGSGAAGTATRSGTTILSVAVTSGGSGYTSAPAVSFSGGCGTGATFTAVVVGGAVTSYTQTAGGTGYTATPTVSVAYPPDATGQSSTGTCTMSNTVTVEVDPDNDGVSWAADAWDQTPSGKRGVIFLEASSETGFTQQHASPVIANDALAAAGTADLTLLLPAPHTDFDSYRLVGEGGESSSIVWRLYGVTDAEVGIAQNTRFSFPVALPNSDHTAAARTTSPTIHVMVDGVERPIGFTIDPDAGTVLLNKPSVTLFGTTSALNLGGAATDGIPDDILYWAAISTGALRAVAPADAGSPAAPVYEGTCYTEEGLERTLVVTLTDWRDESNRENMNRFAAEILDSVKDTIVEGEIGYLDLYADALAPGLALTIEGEGYDTPWSGLELPVMSAELVWHVEPTGPKYSMTMGLSNRRAQVTGASFWAPGMEMDLYAGVGGGGYEGVGPAGGLVAGGPSLAGAAAGVAGDWASGVAGHWAGAVAGDWASQVAGDWAGAQLNASGQSLAAAGSMGGLGSFEATDAPGLSKDAYDELLRKISRGEF